MDDDESDQEYEQIDLDEKRGVTNLKWSPSKRPPIPTPNHPGVMVSKSNPYSLAEGKGTGVRRSVSLKEKNDIPPPLPPPNSSITSTLPRLPPPNVSQKPQRGSNYESSRPRAPPPPIKPRSMTVGDFDGVPAIPPKPGPKTIPFVPTKSPPRRRTVEDDFIIENDELKPEEFVTKFREEFPLHVRVCKGYYGTSNRTSVSEGDSFNIHFIKNTKMVSMVDGGGAMFKLGLNSGIQFGILFDPNNKREEALTGFTFDKIGDMLQLKQPPKVVRVGAAWRGPSQESTLELHALLIFKGWKRKVTSKVMKAFDLNTKERKELPENCMGKFSTRPYDTRLFLSDIMEHVQHPLPCAALLYMNTDLCDFSQLPRFLTPTVFQLKALCTETTLIATGAQTEDYDETDAVEIPFDLDIEFQVMRPKAEKDTEDLYQNTRKLLENYTKLKTPQFLTGEEGESAGAQAALYSIVRQGQELTGVDIVKPTTIYSAAPPSSSTSSISSTPKKSQGFKKTKSETLYEDLNSSEHIDAIHTRIDRVEKDLLQLTQAVEALGNIEDVGARMSKEITAARADMRRLEMRCNKAGEDAAKATSDTTELRPLVEQLSRTCEGMQRDLKSLRTQGNQQAGPGTASPNPKGYMTLSHTAPLESAEELYSEANRKANKDFLLTLDCAMVLTLLDSMGLSQHHEAFMNERVNGEILLECDDNILREEIGIKSKLQRVRLMKIIECKHSAQNILNGEDPYTYARPK